MMISKVLQVGLLAGVGAVAVAAALRRRHTWEVSHGQNGYAVELTRAPAWSLWLADLVPCLHPRGEARCAAVRMLAALCQKRHDVTAGAETHLASLPVGREVAERLAPHTVQVVDRLFPDKE